MKQQINRKRRSHTSPHQSSQIQLSPISKATLANVAFIVFLCVSSWLSSTTWHINQDGSGDFTTIQQGIIASSQGDIVLVYPGTYFENINYNGKNITVASLELTTGDPQYISQTIIDGQRQTSCVKIINNETEAILRGLTITNGQGDDTFYSSSGGISIYSEDDYQIYCSIINCLIINNYATGGAGINVFNAVVSLSGTTIRENYATRAGGAIGVTDNSQIIFDPVNRCNIYNNLAAYMCEIYLSTVQFNNFSVIVDTFTVLNPSEYFVSNTATMVMNYNFDIMNYFIEPIENDLYVSPEGSDDNSGLTSEEPLKTINIAVRNIASNPNNQYTIHLQHGTYNNFTNSLQLPFGCKSNVNIIGESLDNVIIDAESNTSFFLGFTGYENSLLMNVQFVNGFFPISLVHLHNTDNITFKNIKIENSVISNRGAGLVSSTSGGNIWLNNVNIENITVMNGFSAGAHFNETTSFFAKNCIFSNNSSIGYTGLSAGLYAMSSGDIIIENSKFINNRTTSTNLLGWASALLCTDYNSSMGDTYINNCLFSGNTNNGGKSTIFNKSIDNGTVYFTNNTSVNNMSMYGIEFQGYIKCQNNILRNPGDYEIVLFDKTSQGIISEIDIAYNNIEGGPSAVYNQNGVNIINWLEGNIDEDPLFLGSGDDPYQLTEISPCIDAGTPDTTGLFLPPWDLLFNQRIWDGDNNGEAIIDMGCYEYGSSYASGLISGYVIDTAGNLLENAEISAGNFTTFSNENGEFNLEVIVGTYDVVCYLEGYEITIMEDVIVNLGETTIINFILDPAVSIDDILNAKDFQLSNYPNPFNPTTTISFNLPEPGKVKLEIYNIKGQKVKTLLNSTTVPGAYKCIWNGKDEMGKSVSSGQYVIKLQQSGNETAKKIMMLK